MLKIEMTEQQRDNLLAFLTGKGRVQLTGDEAFEFINLVNIFASAKEVIEEE